MQPKKTLFSVVAGMVVCVALSSSTFAAGTAQTEVNIKPASLCPQETNDPDPGVSGTMGPAAGKPARLEPQEQNSGDGLWFGIFG